MGRMSNISLNQEVVEMAHEKPVSFFTPEGVEQAMRQLTAAERNLPDALVQRTSDSNIFSQDTNPAVSGRDPIVMMDKVGLHIVSEKTAEQFRKKQLSASLVTELREGCPAAWVAKTYVVPEVIETPPDNPMTRGSFFHRIMEHFFRLPAAERTRDALKQCIKITLDEPDYEVFKTNLDVRDWLQEALRGYYKLGEDPQGVQVATINTKTGLEVFVKGKLPGASRNLIGFIDRVSSSADGGVMVEDWKTGAKLKQWEGGYPELVKNKDGSTSYNTRNAAGYAEARQQMIYTTLLRQNGYQVDGARLMFPVAGGVAKVPVDDPTFQQAVVADVVEIDQKMDELEESNEFSYNPSVLCSWCPLAKFCPAARTPYNDKQETARNEQPDFDQFDGTILLKA